MNVKEVQLSIVVPVKGQPGRCVGTLVRRVPEDMTLPEIIKGVRKELGEETEGCIYLDPENYRQSVHDWNVKRAKKVQVVENATQEPVQEVSVSAAA